MCYEFKTYIERLEGNSEWRMVNSQASGARDSSHDEHMRARFQFPLSPATVNQHRQTPQDDMSEFMIMGLRLTKEGIMRSAFRERFGRELGEVYGEETDDLRRLDLLEWVNHSASEAEESEILRLTPRGRLLGNQVFMRFV